MKNGMNAKRRALEFSPRLVIFLIVLVAIAAASLYAWRTFGPDADALPAPTYWPTAGWHTNTPEAAGLDSVTLAEGLQAVKKSNINIHNLMLVGRGEVILDAYFYPYDGSTYHDMASCTKSVMTTLIGIAVDQGKLSLDDKVLSFFPDRTIANRDARKESVTVRQLASMCSGFSCTARPTEVTLAEMNESPDWVQFALDRPMAREPGKTFVYDSLGMHLLSAILQKATGMTALEFARQNLFGPLGIIDVHWPSDPQGYTRGWGDLCLHSGDAAKIGFLFMHGGKWENKQIVSREWVKAATSRQIDAGGDYPEDYGYGWWISAEGDEPPYFQAEGRQTQRILVVPSMNLIVVATGGGYNLDDVTQYVEEAIVDLEKPILANPAGVAQLEAAVAKCVERPPAQPVPSFPDVAHAISGKTFAFEAGIIRSIRLDFNDSAVALLHLDVNIEDNPRLLRVGLDGVYRPSISERPSVARGSWTDDKTFTIDYNEGPGLNYYRLVMRFEGDHVTVEIAGLGTMEGNLT
jgi:CubicO group peptidase (beta-lactamase class C family)